MNETTVTEILRQVPDPEIPHLNIVDLGMVDALTEEEGVLTVALIPTFVGCPAQGIIERTVRERLQEAFPDRKVAVRFSLHQAWSTRRITDAGRQALRESGIAPPGDDLDHVACPYCGHADSVLQNLFGATSCRSLFYCSHCKNPFEAFKPL